ncbi:location of vulva defective 1 [Oryzias melastigma]|uniref:location of vulva defective 1 n=1 Tax=Oryzias melastigma TaxID=30732 RepID=UPI000CF81F4A|nr:location of vulva defective 1 [Oryzias melastigma]
MELTVLVPLLSLLVLKLGYADHDENLHTASPVSAEQVPVGPAGAEVPDLNQNHSIQAWNISDTNTNSSSSLSNNARVEIKNSSESLQPADYNVTDVGTTNVSDTHKSPTIPSPLRPNTTLLPTPGVIHTTTAPTVNTTLPTNDSDISNHSAALDLVSVTTSKQPTQTETASTPTTTEPKVSSTSSGSSLSTSSPSSTAPLKPTAQSDTSTQTKAHTGRPAQLNVGGDTVTTNKTPTLDPLLAGLVSAFILTAIIIASLLFFKLRRRDSRPEFRRLQDLPMDDMMEDTPLSMYSY